MQIVINNSIIYPKKNCRTNKERYYLDNIILIFLFYTFFLYILIILTKAIYIINISGFI